MLDIRVELTKTPKAKPADESKLGFGKEFSDHMFVMDYDPDNGWHDARIIPYQPFQMDPACVVFHYAQEIFEGLKAYRTADRHHPALPPGLQRPAHAATPLTVCACPNIPVEDFVQAVKALVEVDQGLGAPHRRHFPVYPPLHDRHRCGSGRPRQPSTIASASSPLPPAPTMPRASTPVRIYVEDEYIRAAPGLTGFMQVRRQLRCLHQGRRPGRTAGLCPGAVAGRRGEEVRGRGRRHEHHVQDRRQDLHRSLRGHRAARRHPPQLHRAAAAIGAMRSCEEQTGHRRHHEGWPTTASWKRSSAPAPPPWSPRSRSWTGRATRCLHQRRQDRPARPRSSTTPSPASSGARSPTPRAGPFLWNNIESNVFENPNEARHNCVCPLVQCSWSISCCRFLRNLPAWAPSICV